MEFIYWFKNTKNILVRMMSMLYTRCMTKNADHNLKRHIEIAPSGTVFTNTWLEKQGISAKLAWWYVREGLLERVGTKAYKKANDEISWVGVVAALQNQMDLPLHVGGVTALQLLDQGQDDSDLFEIMLFADLETRVPSWLNSGNFYEDFELYRTSLFSKRSLGVIQQNFEGFNVQMSCVEKAAMEVIYQSPKRIEMIEMTDMMEGLSRFRSSMVQLLLESCNSIKVKRMFLYFADRFWRPLVSKLDLSKIDLGNGKRMVGRGGRYRYHPKYMLSLPEKIDEPDPNGF